MSLLWWLKKNAYKVGVLTIFLYNLFVIYIIESAFSRKRRKEVDADFLLIHKMKNGDEEAIEVFVKKYYSTIRNYCRLHTYTDCDAEDITQATFEHFFRSFRSYHHLGKTANYLYVIARNLCRDSYKKKRDIVMEALPDKGENPIAVIENKIDIEESIKKLPEDLQEVVILHYFQDLKLKEVADIIGIGLPLVKYRIGKAKELLSVYLGDKK